jgi:predicted transcriptional regulator
MKSATIPSVRVEPEFRQEVETLLAEGEALTRFVESAVRETVARRKSQAEFVRRGMASIDETKGLNNGVPADVVLAKLEARLAAAKQAMAQRKQLPTHRP